MTNISAVKSIEETLAQFFRVLGQPLRIQILLVLQEDDACVCHLEARLGVRQALLSQHLMVLREAGLVNFYREGRNIYYRLSSTLLPLLIEAARQLGYSSLAVSAPPGYAQPCPCPRCNPDAGAEISCSNLKDER